MSYKISNFTSTLPIGEYEFEIESVERAVSGDSQSTKLSLQVISPAQFSGRKLINRVFERTLNNIVKGITGKSVPDHFKDKEEVSDEEVFKLIDGKFFKAKLGVKNGYNEIGEVLESKSNENAPATI